jgi:hypothetical protein
VAASWSVRSQTKGVLAPSFGLLDAPPHHMTRWNDTVFRSLEKILPLKIREIRFEPVATYHLGHYHRAAIARLQLPFLKRLAATDVAKRLYFAAMARARVRFLCRGHTMLVIMERT